MPLRACAAMMLLLGTRAIIPPDEALLAFAKEGGLLEGLAAMVEARETGGIPAAAASRAIKAAFALATQMAAEAESLDQTNPFDLLGPARAPA
jgi:hypothetical protein